MSSGPKLPREKNLGSQRSDEDVDVDDAGEEEEAGNMHPTSTFLLLTPDS